MQIIKKYKEILVKNLSLLLSFYYYRIRFRIRYKRGTLWHHLRWPEISNTIDGNRVVYNTTGSSRTIQYDEEHCFLINNTFEGIVVVYHYPGIEY